MGETRVVLQHLLEDLRDAYTGSLEESIVTELVANALDAGASDIRFVTDPAESSLTIVDDGRGMQRRELARYHDVAASGKKRGEGIGFAGVGIKLGLLVSRDVLTETRRGATHLASSWSLTSRYRAPWKWVPPPGLVAARGTAIRLRLANPLSPLLDPGFLAEVIRRHFEPLLDSAFDAILKRHYPRPITFQIDSAPLLPSKRARRDVVPVSIRLARKRTPSALGYLARSDMPLAETECAIAVSTFGKVIKRGWDWLGIAAPALNHVGGPRRGSRSRGLSDAEQERFRAQRHARRHVSGLSEGAAGSGVSSACGLGRFPCGFTCATAFLEARSRSRARARRSRR